MKPAREARLYHVLRTANASFSSFIVGQCTEAVILGVLCILGMLIFRFPYAMMTGTVVGVMALIPIVGAYVGAAVGTFMIFTVDPLQAVFFLIFLIILQQIEGNLIYPKVVGSSIGLPGMWVLAAVLIGGGLGGIAGMLVGVPLAATLYKLLRETVQKREKSMQHAESESGKRPVSAAEIFGRSKKSLDEQRTCRKAGCRRASRCAARERRRRSAGLRIGSRRGKCRVGAKNRRSIGKNTVRPDAEEQPRRKRAQTPERRTQNRQPSSRMPCRRKKPPINRKKYGETGCRRAAAPQSADGKPEALCASCRTAGCGSVRWRPRVSGESSPAFGFSISQMRDRRAAEHLTKACICA